MTKKQKKKVLDNLFGKVRTVDEQIADLYEIGTYDVPDIMYVKFMNGHFTLRKNFEHKHYYGNYQVRFASGTEVFEVLRMQYDIRFNNYQIVVKSLILDTVTAGMFNVCYPQYYNKEEGTFVFNTSDCILMRDDKTLKGENSI